MAGKDHYYNKAKQQGYRARSAYKLQQLDEAASLFDDGMTVVDLGAAPGGWLQVAIERVGETGSVLGVDRQRIDPIEGVETIRGDMTDEETRTAVIERVGSVDVVVSDMAPNMTGEYSLDHARSVHLATQAFETAMEVLDAGGDFVAKVFDGPDLDAFETTVEKEFQYVRRIQPDASRKESSELYLVGKGRLTAPVAVGEQLSVTIEDTGNEGDGIAKVEGYTLFVPNVPEGESVTIEVTDVKPNFGFAERLE
ncbi:23S rRNA (uridine(2552)-2'-O)-methyltransferase [Halocatena halophila]|uniref:23S rRNA (uridine(2552)-2'-O)-methyltransferase n=1 Tax=Halocatena halophila TaxID=2814576 RepID=UPI002ED10E68